MSVLNYYIYAIFNLIHKIQSAKLTLQVYSFASYII